MSKSTSPPSWQKFPRPHNITCLDTKEKGDAITSVAFLFILGYYSDQSTSIFGGVVSVCITTQYCSVFSRKA